jgi:dTDP-4-dehydrorhamnose 3,5-epimerase
MVTLLPIPGACVLPLVRHADARGAFLKVYHAPTLQALGMGTGVAESFVTRSHRGVIRGMHFQVPPHDHDKLVCCLAGTIQDVLVDLRVGSPAYGQAVSWQLDGNAPATLVVPRGVAHGFACLSPEALVLYHTSSAHAPTADLGIRWDSLGVAWQVDDPILSERDRGFPPLEAFHSPFRYSDRQESP